MTSWEWSIPATILAAGFFHLLLARELKKFTPLYYSLLGFGCLLVADAVFAAHLLAGDVATASQVPTRIAYLLTLINLAWTSLYLVIMGAQWAGQEAIKSGRHWR